MKASFNSVASPVVNVWVRGAAGVILLSLAVAAGCGKPDSGPRVDGSLSDQYSIPASDLEDARQRAKAAVVTAGNSAPPPALALLTSTTSTRIGMCSAFLIGQDLVATNSHCIPRDLRAPGSSCADRIWLHFPESGRQSARRVECAEVIEATKIASDEDPSKKNAVGRPDYAFLRLREQVGRVPLEISHEGFADRHRYRIFKVNPLERGNLPVGEVEEVSCLAINRSELTASPHHARSSVMTLADCEARSGNSGSPVLGADGRVRGLLHAISDPTELARVLKGGGFTLDPSGIAVLNFATGLGCVRTPVDLPGLALDPVCTDPKAAAAAAQALGSHREGIAAELTQIARESSLDSGLKWDLELLNLEKETLTRIELGLDGKSLVVVPKPLCIGDVNGWLKAHHLKPRQSATETRFEAPVLRVYVKASRYLEIQPSIDRTPLRKLGLALQFSPRDLTEKGASEFSVQVLSGLPYLSHPIIYKGKLSACP